LVTPDYKTFEQLPAARYLLTPARNVPHFPVPVQMRELANGLVAGRRFVLLIREP
jgi:hypothetical protein